MTHRLPLAGRLTNPYPAPRPFPRPLPLISRLKSAAFAREGNSHRAEGFVPAAPPAPTSRQPLQSQMSSSCDPAAGLGSRWDLRLFLPAWVRCDARRVMGVQAAVHVAGVTGRSRVSPCGQAALSGTSAPPWHVLGEVTFCNSNVGT